MDDLAFALDPAVDGHQSRIEKLAPLPVANIAPDDDVGCAGFVLERHENDAALGIGPLTSDDDAGDARESSMRRMRNVLCRHDALVTQLPPQQRKRMAAQREPEAAVIGDDFLSFGGRWQCGRRFGESCARENFRQSLDAGDFPYGVVTMATERDERIGIGERGEIATIELRAMCKIGYRFERRAATRFDDPFR